MSGNEEFWASGTWMFLIYGFIVLAIAKARSVYMDRRYREANPNPDSDERTVAGQ